MSDVEFFWDDLKPTENEIKAENNLMEKRQSDFRLAAQYVAKAFSSFESVKRIILFGSVTGELVKEESAYRKFRQAGTLIYHECRDVDLAIYIEDFSSLNSLRKACVSALADLLKDTGIGVAHHQLDVYLFDYKSGNYTGRLCIFGKCPKGKFVCKVPGCGKVPFLRQHEGFVFNGDKLSKDKSVILFQRAV